jgi:uncharacterized OB-fold protein
MCPACAGALTSMPVEGAGTLVSWTVIRRPPKSFREHGAYCIAIVDLDAGVRITGRLRNTPAHAALGERVSLVGCQDRIPVFALDP